ncbi:holdfast attachment protein HfaA [Caulobacter ginsengisoli]|uniref:Holdfast attachment protein HfaA n=1 Tax=Caulobacter ginsengisoli TaxID=400775 RepID=A0ABU0IKJ5_9CAUL|nr:holdfast anchoring protein HfaA [Caulobacter ginsengisoli]MDQ0462535.1 holdfast attachment protein HfaA [Caulobacter ginsengisoli]
MADLKITASLALAALAVAGAATAQSISTNSAGYNAGYGRVSGQENRPVSVGGTGQGNRVIVDGVILAGEDQSVFASQTGGGVFSDTSGVGNIGGSSTAIGNNLIVITQGNYNTVVITSVQTNNGNVTAGSTTSGGVGN